MQWSALLDSYLEGTPVEPADSSRLTVLNISFPAELLEQELFAMLNSGRLLSASVLSSVPAPIAVHGHAMGLQLLYSNAQQCVELALGLLREKHGFPFCIALDISTGWTVDSEWRGMARYRAERLANFGGNFELLLTEELNTAITLPDGVGVFAAPAKRSQFVGVPFWIVKDYR